jgi:hypothetical protein
LDPDPQKPTSRWAPGSRRAPALGRRPCGRFGSAAGSQQYGNADDIAVEDSHDERDADRERFKRARHVGHDR